MKKASQTATEQGVALASSIAYLTLMVTILETVSRNIRDKDNPYLNIHLPALPAVLASTYLIARLRKADTQAWERMPDDQDLRQLAAGLFFGSGAILSVLGIAAAKGWVSAPAWGWQKQPTEEVLRSAALLLANQLAIVWNEEQVFRGYGLDSLQQAIGLPTAASILAVLFAVYHGTGTQQLISLVLAGALLTLLRLESKGLWLPFGFHLAWNIWQVAVFGPSTGPISIRPLQLHGPIAWIGKPGQPEPGGIAIIVTAIVVGILSIRLWRRHKTK